jgi:ATP-dependent RNA helicase SUPV3L1/SUV3
VLLAQRIEVLSTKPWATRRPSGTGLRNDVAHWQEQAAALQADASWPSLDMKFPPLLDASRGQLLAVWDAFQSALAMAVAAAGDPAAPLPPVPVWADELRVARRSRPRRPPKPGQKPQGRPRSARSRPRLVQECPGQAGGRNRRRPRQGQRRRGCRLAQCAQGATASWSRQAGKQGPCRAGRRRRTGGLAALARRPAARGTGGAAEGLLKPAKPVAEGQAIGGRKMQENLRALREQWKQTDQGGVPNHAMWKRFDEACNEAHKVVEAWLDKVRTEAAEHKRAAPGADRGSQGLGRRQHHGAGRRLARVRPHPAPVR